MVAEQDEAFTELITSIHSDKENDETRIGISEKVAVCVREVGIRLVSVKMSERAFEGGSGFQEHDTHEELNVRT